MKTGKLKRKTAAISHIFLILVSLYTVFPLLIIFSMAFKTNQEILLNVLSLPKSYSLESVIEVWRDSRFNVYFLNSMIVTLPHVLIVVVLTVMVSYGLVFTRIPHKDAIFSFILVGFMIPIQAIIIPLFYSMTKARLINSRFTLALLEAAMYLPFCVFLLRSFFRNIPLSLIEATRMDGANNFQIIRYVIVSVAKPAIFTVIILQFKNSWNEFLLPLVMLQQERIQTLTLGFSRLQGGRYTLNYNSIGAAALIVSIPMIIIFILFQGKFIQGLAGAVKE
jgi:ABC-type glycerol-3-phosphate transport system permease component